MVRTAQTTRKAAAGLVGRRWIQREYVDHQGNPVVLGKYISEEEDFTRPEGEARFIMQIYSSIPLQESDYGKIDGYLSESDLFRTPKFEIYSYRPRNALACVEHQRHEIAYRKHLHVEAKAAGQSTEAIPPLTPMAEKLSESRDRVEFCIFLASESFRAGFIGMQRKALGTGPQWIYFDRRNPSGVSEIPMVERLHDHEIRREVWELEVISKTYQERLDSDVMETISNIMAPIVIMSSIMDWTRMRQPSPSPSPSDDPRHIMNALTQQIQGLQILQGIVIFSTLSMLLFWAISRTLQTFYKPLRASSPQALLPISLPTKQYISGFTCQALRCHPSFLNTLNLCKTRSLLWVPYRRWTLRSVGEHFLSVPRIGLMECLTPAGYSQSCSTGHPSPNQVLFIKATSDYPPDGDDDELWMEVRRSAGMPEVARRLAVLAVEEHQAGVADTRGVLSPEEHSAVWSAASESYKERQNCLRRDGDW
ncbi:hypothetical protein SI65_06306 [Aspergillus cristatus]|uniref:Uncharacterized protein n=1 Tax=Aspergillus cristatus TaxID=573508 RepID=A0A1E3BBU2_ASPCR|nr:hypothetical protein SI65_06306 [Aspergillus cristatus]